MQIPNRSKLQIYRTTAAVLFCTAPVASAEAAGLQGLERLSVSPSATASEDRRVDVKTFGIKTGCKGDTVEANIQFTRMTAAFRADGTQVALSYVGEYTRQGWSTPCVPVPSLLNGVEYKKISGQYTFLVRIGADGAPIIDPGDVKALSPITDPSHDSNLQAVRAVRNAITTLSKP